MIRAAVSRGDAGIRCHRLRGFAPAATASASYHISPSFSVLMYGASQVAQRQRIPLPMQEMQETQVQSLGWEDPLEKQTATLSDILAWNIPWTKESGGATVSGVLMYTILWEFYIHTYIIHYIIYTHNTLYYIHIYICLCICIYANDMCI